MLSLTIRHSLEAGLSVVHGRYLFYLELVWELRNRRQVTSSMAPGQMLPSLLCHTPLFESSGLLKILFFFANEILAARWNPSRIRGFSMGLALNPRLLLIWG